MIRLQYFKLTLYVYLK